MLRVRTTKENRLEDIRIKQGIRNRTTVPREDNGT